MHFPIETMYFWKKWPLLHDRGYRANWNHYEVILGIMSFHLINIVHRKYMEKNFSDQHTLPFYYMRGGVTWGSEAKLLIGSNMGTDVTGYPMVPRPGGLPLPDWGPSGVSKYRLECSGTRTGRVVRLWSPPEMVRQGNTIMVYPCILPAIGYTIVYTIPCILPQDAG